MPRFSQWRTHSAVRWIWLFTPLRFAENMGTMVSFFSLIIVLVARSQWKVDTS